MAKPEFDEFNNLAKEIECDWNEFKELFGFSPERKRLIQKVEPAIKILTEAGVFTLLIGGSFASSSKNPPDIDAIYFVLSEFDESKLPENYLLFFENCGLDLIPDIAISRNEDMTPFSFMKRDMNGNERKLIRLDLTSFA